VRAAEEIARRAAAAGATVLRERAGNMGNIRTKSSDFDFVSEADIAAGVAVVRSIADADPSARFVVEEPEVYALGQVAEGDPGDPAVWVIDPLDGTTSFIHGYPTYSVSVAYLEHGVPQAGAVHNVPFGEVVSAARGSGARRDDRPATVANAETIQSALLITGFPYDRGSMLDRQLAIFSVLAREAHGIRRDGSAAVDCCHVACGRADAFWELGLQTWDTAAGVVILEESGATVSDLRGNPWTVETRDFLAANPVLHTAMLARIAELDPTL
jgi:myo-inositol-1(or 4)-monophosphatase